MHKLLKRQIEKYLQKVAVDDEGFNIFLPSKPRGVVVSASTKELKSSFNPRCFSSSAKYLSIVSLFCFGSS